MSQFRLLFGLVVLTYVFSCKAPSSTAQAPVVVPPPPGGSSSIPSASLPNPDELQMPNWWIEEDYSVGGIDGKGRPGSPHAVVFQPNVNGWTVMGRTKGGARLQTIGTYEKIGDSYVIKTPDLFFGVDDDGNWNKTIIYKGKKLVKGGADWNNQYLMRMAGDWSSNGTINKFWSSLPNDIPKNATWIWQMELDGFQQAYIIVYQRPDYGQPIKGPQTAMELEKQNKDFDRQYSLSKSALGDYLTLSGKPTPPGIPLHLQGTTLELTTEFVNNNIYFRLASTNNVHVYYLKKTGNTGSNGQDEVEWKELEIQNAGGKSGFLDKKN